MGAITPAGRSAAPVGFPLPLRLPAAGGLAREAMPSQRRVVVLTDLSSAGVNAAWRAALVARDRRVPLHLLNVQPTEAALSASQARAQALAGELRERLRLQVTWGGFAGDLLAAGAQAAGEAGLFVLAAGRGRLLAEWVMGSTAERLLRRCAVPVLVVRRPAYTSYRSVVVPVELQPQADTLLAAAQALSRDPRMKVLHVLPTVHEESLRLADVPDRVIRQARERAAARVRVRLDALIADTAAGEHGAQSVVRFGSPVCAVLEQQRAARADLLVLGKRPRAALVDFLAGSVTQRLLASAAADVLVVPLPPPAPQGAPWLLLPQAPSP